MDKKAREKARYEYLKSRNICVACGKEKALENNVHCLICKMDARESKKKFRENHKERLKEYIKENMESIYKKRKEAGICVKCGTRKTENGFATCKTCRAKARNKYKSKREEREYLNLCRLCGAKSLYKNTKVCEKCYKERIVKMRSLNTKRNNDYWRKLNDLAFIKKVN